MAEFVKTPNGICIVSALGPEHTLCGDAFDLGSDELGYEWKPTASRTVTCPNCARQIKAVRDVRIQPRSKSND